MRSEGNNINRKNAQKTQRNMNILVTGAKGFVGRNLGMALRRREGVTLFEYDLGSDEGVLEEGLRG